MRDEERDSIETVCGDHGGGDRLRLPPGLRHADIFGPGEHSLQRLHGGGGADREDHLPVRDPFSTSLGMVALNVPVALFCFKHIGKKFVVFSMIQVFLASFFLRFAHFTPLFDDALLNICFGGFVYGMAIVTALKGNASTAGTDFIALYVSNRTGKAIWQYVFMGNACMLCIFGYMFGWEYAGYSIMFQFISTQTIDRFYHRYKRVTLQITTHDPDAVVKEYVKNYRHGVSVMNGYGGYSGASMSLLHTVVSSYEVQDIVHHLKHADPKVIVNVLPTETFFGGFYQKPID